MNFGITQLIPGLNLGFLVAESGTNRPPEAHVNNADHISSLPTTNSTPALTSIFNVNPFRSLASCFMNSSGTSNSARTEDSAITQSNHPVSQRLHDEFVQMRTARQIEGVMRTLSLD